MNLNNIYTIKPGGKHERFKTKSGKWLKTPQISGNKEDEDVEGMRKKRDEWGGDKGDSQCEQKEEKLEEPLGSLLNKEV